MKYILTCAILCGVIRSTYGLNDANILPPSFSGANSIYAGEVRELYLASTTNGNKSSVVIAELIVDHVIKGDSSVHDVKVEIFNSTNKLTATPDMFADMKQGRWIFLLKNPLHTLPSAQSNDSVCECINSMRIASKVPVSLSAKRDTGDDLESEFIGMLVSSEETLAMKALWLFEDWDRKSKKIYSELDTLSRQSSGDLQTVAVTVRLRLNDLSALSLVNVCHGKYIKHLGWVISTIREPSAIPELIKMMDNNDVYIRRGVARSLCAFSHKPIAHTLMPVFKKALDDTDTEIQLTAIHGLAKFGLLTPKETSVSPYWCPAPLPSMEYFQNDPDKYVKAWKAVLADSNMVANVLR